MKRKRNALGQIVHVPDLTTEELQAIRKQWGLPVKRGRRQRWTPQEDRYVKALSMHGYTMRQVSDILVCSTSNIQRALKG